MADAPHSRKLATIMSVDVAGYSRMAEADDSAAADAVAQLKEALARIAAPLGGRIFNTAGDGVMLEFPVASAGVQAALQFLAEAKSGERTLPKARVGLHLGEVIVAENGDLLGHGVNVAARLQALAAPGSAMVSLAVQAQVRNAATITFVPQGRVRLDKMAETMEVFALAPQGERPETSRAMRLRQILRPSVLGPAFALVVLAGAAIFVNLAPATRVVSTPAVTVQTPRLAVLRFETLDKTDPYFAEGVADELISEASRIPGLEVTARASSFALTGVRGTPTNAARELGATLVLTGAVRAAPDAIRVNAQLSEAATGRLIWSRSFQRPSGEVFTLQRDIALDVARAAGLRAGVREPRRVDPEAFRLYLRGRELWLKRVSTRVAGARDIFRLATERDPSFADAWAWLARAELLLAERANYDAGPGHALTAEALAPVLRYADRALALDRSLSIPYEARGAVFADLGRWSEAAAAADASELHGGRNYRSRLATGQASAALPALHRRAELNPLDHGDASALAYACYSSGDYACAIRAAQRALELEPRYSPAVGNLFLALVMSGDRAGARRAIEEHADSLEEWIVADPVDRRRFMLSLVGDGPIIPAAEITGTLDRGKVFLNDAIVLLALTGQTREAAALLPRWGAADRQYLNELFEPGLTALRSTPEFWAVMEREGLVRYWRESGKWPDFCATERNCPK